MGKADCSDAGPSENYAQNVHVDERDWTPAEERALVRKLDLRVLLPSFIIYVLAYLDRGNIGSVKILQAGKPASLEKSLHMKGTEFNWVRHTPTLTFNPEERQRAKGTIAGRVSYLFRHDHTHTAFNLDAQEDFSKGVLSRSDDLL